MADESLMLEFGEHSQRLLDGSVRGPLDSPDSQVDNIELIEAEISQVIMNRVDEFLAAKSVNPGLVCSPASAHLGVDHQSVRIGMQRLLDYLIRHVRTIKVARIDMVHTRFN